MTAQILALILAAWLVALGLGTAIMRRHRFAPIVGVQLSGLGSIVAILALVGPDGALFVVLLAALSGLMGLLAGALQSVAKDETITDEGGDPLKW